MDSSFQNLLHRDATLCLTDFSMKMLQKAKESFDKSDIVKFGIIESPLIVEHTKIIEEEDLKRVTFV